MYNRSFNPPKSRSFFLFGARGTGKTTLLQELFKATPVVWIDLLDPDQEDRYLKRPGILQEELERAHAEWVVIDEVQKNPRLLNVVHKELTRKRFKFALTGSSSRRLKQRGANLLAGRASTFALAPLTTRELGPDFRLEGVLQYGSLPGVFELEPADRIRFLQAYAQTYVRQEIQAEQWVKNLPVFRCFLDVAAQANTRILNYSNIARAIGCEPPTVKSYFEILEDTYLGFRLPAWDTSIREQQRKAPKFYFFDPGVTRSLRGLADIEVRESTSDFGEFFEQWVVLELSRENAYREKGFRMSYFLTKDQAEVDLILEKPRQPPILVEIKSARKIEENHLNTIARVKKELRGARAFCLSRDPVERLVRGVACLPWAKGIAEILG